MGYRFILLFIAVSVTKAVMPFMRPDGGDLSISNFMLGPFLAFRTLGFFLSCVSAQ